MTEEKKKKEHEESGYDKYVDWKYFSIPLVMLLLLLIIPTPSGMMDVGVEYSMGPKYVQDYFGKEFFGKGTNDLEQWQLMMVRAGDAYIQQGAFDYKAFVDVDDKWYKQNKIRTTKKHIEQVKAFLAQVPEEKFEDLMRKGRKLRMDDLTIDTLKSDEDKAAAKKGGFHVQVAVGIILFVVGCFVTEAIPLPMVGLCVGIISLATGIMSRGELASSYWSDSTWFIMGSLMFATAFVKTGVDKRIAMAMFGRLKSLDIKWITLAILCVVSPLSMFMSDHALAAMFLPIIMMLYATSTAAYGKEDPELGKMLAITLAFGCNLSGSLAPSGAARNIIMMNYLEQMFGIQISYGQWCLYQLPLLFITLPICWFMLNWRFKPQIKDLSPAMNFVREEINKVGGGRWSKQQIITILIFSIVLFFWIVDEDLMPKLFGYQFGLGALAVVGAIAYIFVGIANWRDYQTKVDWGVVWLYAGAIHFGAILVKTGGAYWIARAFVESVAAPMGLGKGLGLLLSGNVIVGIVTQFMADGPACAAVGPVTLSMAGMVHPGTSLLPFVAMGTAYASSLAYCLVIGTPPNAIVYASGYLVPKDYFRVGLILWFVNLGISMLMSATYWMWMGWPGLKPF